MERAYERLLRYVRVSTASDGQTGTTPSTQRQFDLANMLVSEMKEMGIEDARADEKCYVYGTIPASPGFEDRPAVGFIAHLDTAPDFSGEHVQPQVIPNYDGKRVALGESGRELSPEVFPDLERRVGHTLITTDGTTLLGADDKAGIAEIMAAAEQILSGDEPHGKVCLAFTPDEEIGGGAKDLDLEDFGADFAYTLDGDAENQIVYENFNASCAEFEINGFNIHPGHAKDKMVNASLIAARIAAMLPPFETPRETSGYEGFFHLTEMEGNVEKARLVLIVRDHDKELFRGREEMLRHIEKSFNEMYGPGTVKLTIRQQYANMAEPMRAHMHVVERAKEAIRGLGLEPFICPIRGGTDGAQLTWRGLPCPNLGTGGEAFHGPYEYISAEAMDTMVQIVIGIVRGCV